MLSLAALRYRNVRCEDGGPVAEIQTGVLPIFDRPMIQATVFLRPELIAERPRHVVYGSADGTGSAENVAIARHMAVSEALERWAYYATHNSSDRARYAFDHDRTSNGMAAFPGFRWQARRRAQFEALERFALVGWWDRRFPSTDHQAPYPGVRMVRINHGVGFGEVVVLYHRTAAGFTAYGHAAGRSVATAASRAAVELVRCAYVIGQYRARGALTPVTDHLEQRCLYYASPEGYADFLDRVEAKPDKPASVWRTIFDGEIPGPWSQWATVWRHCVEMPTYAFLNRRENFFFW
jgi:hypothetical protein